jgi:exonuclease III
VTDHGSFVLFNVYVPNAGDRPARSRLPAKLSFLAGLREQVEELRGAGRQVTHAACDWNGLFQFLVQLCGAGT